MPSYPGPGAPPYDHPTTTSSKFYGALGGNQVYGDGYSVSSSTLGKGASFQHNKRCELIRSQVSPTYTDTRSQDRSRKHKHSSKSKGKGRTEADLYGGGGGEGNSLARNVPQVSSDRSSQDDYYQNYSHYGSGGGQPHGTGSNAAQSGYGGQGGHALSQGQSLHVVYPGSRTHWSICKRRDSTQVPLPREASPVSPLKPISAAPTGTSTHSPEACTSREAELEGLRQVVSDKAQEMLAH